MTSGRDPDEPIEAEVERLLGDAVRWRGEVGGGCINQARLAVTTSGRTVFVKSNPAAPPDMFPAEAAGLRALAQVPDGCRVPAVLAESSRVLILEALQPTRGGAAFEEALGRGLAATHRVTRRDYGFTGDNYIGATPQPNEPHADWVVFFRDRRLGHMQDLLRRAGRSDSGLERGLDTLRADLEQWLRLPNERPALLHGDLWSGNAMAVVGGAAIYDPAVYYGVREADLAMTELFGGFSSRFWASYDEVFPRSPGYAERRDLYNLYHLLNHALLFGGGYVSQSRAVIQRYVGAL